MKNIFFIGIGGIGMSSLAQYYKHIGYNVSGSDSNKSELTDYLNKKGIKVYINHNEKNINTHIDLIIKTYAIHKNNVELKKAKKLNIPIMDYPENLGNLTKEKYTICIAGTHGKSTITAMIVLSMIQSGLNPTVIIGTKLKEFQNTNFYFGKSNFLVVESCEYKEAFLNYHPNIVVISNIDYDHLDYYPTKKSYDKAFYKLVKKIPKYGYVIYDADDKSSAEITKNLKCNKIPIKFEKKNFVFENQKFDYISPQVPGFFNMKNTAMAFVVNKILDTKIDKAIKALSEFSGTWRRLEYKGKILNIDFFDDYGHHPNELKNTFLALKEKYKTKKLLVIFQPHQYNRTKNLYNDFKKVLQIPEKVLIPNIYITREKVNEDIKTIVENLDVKNNIYYTMNFENTIKELEDILKKDKNYIVLTIGAGDIYKIYDLLKK